MAHPYAKFSQDKHGSDRAKALVGRAEGGGVTDEAGPAGTYRRYAPGGQRYFMPAKSIQEKGMETLHREYGRNPVTGGFGGKKGIKALLEDKAFGRDQPDYAEGGAVDDGDNPQNAPAAQQNYGNDLNKAYNPQQQQAGQQSSKFQNLLNQPVGRSKARAGREAASGFARGGRTKKPSINVNIISPQGGKGPPMPPPALGLGAPGPGVPIPPPGGALPPGGMPMKPPMKRGGPVKKPAKDAYLAGGKVKMTGAADGAMGRLQKTRAAKARRGG